MIKVQTFSLQTLPKFYGTQKEVIDTIKQLENQTTQREFLVSDNAGQPQILKLGEKLYFFGIVADRQVKGYSCHLLVNGESKEVETGLIQSILRGCILTEQLKLLGRNKGDGYQEIGIFSYGENVSVLCLDVPEAVSAKSIRPYSELRV